MKIYKRILVLLTVAVLLICTAVTAFAAENIDTNRSISLTLYYHDGVTPLSGAEFSIYQVATVDEYGKLITTKEFSNYNVNIEDSNPEKWKILASTLEGYVLRDKLSPTDSQKTNEQGLALFPNEGVKLSPGLYLVLGTRHTQNEMFYETLPFMISMPMQDEDADEWNYDVAVRPKHVSRSIYEVGATTCRVLKVWKDEGNEINRPKEVVIQLLRDGEIYDTVTLNDENNWRYRWSDLDIHYQWRIVEKELEDYTVEISRDGVTFVITNTCTKEITTEPVATSSPAGSVAPSVPGGSVTPSAPGSSVTPSGSAKPIAPNGTTLPQTGQLWWPVPLLAAAGLLMILVGLLLFRGTKNDEN